VRIKEELTFESKFDVVLVNDILEDALLKAETIVSDFTGTQRKYKH
jgi:hypothetical protein